MAIALALAAGARGRVEPNPMVGAVVVREGRELGRGWHGRFGGPHAEREALAAVRAAGRDPRGATMYVTLEPCCHHGKTPPCTDALREAGLARVVLAMPDPDPRVAGKGAAILRAAGMEVVTGVLGDQARELLAAYVKLRTQRRPWVICKWAQTADGLLALPPGQGRWISGEASRARVHEVRAWCDGICAGVGTVLADDPLLTNRSGGGKQPTRVVLDARLRTPDDCGLVRTAGEFPLLVATTAAGVRTGRADRLREARAEVLELPAGDQGVDLAALLDELGRREWTYLLVEGGRAVLASFLGQGLADELMMFVSPRSFPDAAADIPRLDVAAILSDGRWALVEEQTLGEDRVARYRMRG